MHDVAENPYVEEDEINLLDLLLVLLRHKWMIMIIVFLTGAAAVGISLLLPNIYRSEATLTIKVQEEEKPNPLSALGGFGGAMAMGLGLGGAGSLEKLDVVLNSRYLTHRVIKKHDLMPIILSDNWDKKNKKWIEEPGPTLQDAGLAMQNLLTINVDTTKGTITVGFDQEDPETAKNIIEYYLTELSEVLREEVLQDARENQRFFRKQLEQTTDTLLIEKIYAMLAKEIEKETFARAQKDYSFQVLDPPVVPDPDKKVGPKRALICILSVLVAFFLAAFLAFFVEYFQRLKQDDPERYLQLREGLRIGKKKD